VPEKPVPSEEPARPTWEQLDQIREHDESLLEFQRVKQASQVFADMGDLISLLSHNRALVGGFTLVATAKPGQCLQDPQTGKTAKTLMIQSSFGSDEARYVVAAALGALQGPFLCDILGQAERR